jgi:hypothetical protein
MEPVCHARGPSCLSAASTLLSSGHQRAINPGDERYLTVTPGHLAPQVRHHISQIRTNSQADSAGSVSITRSNQKPQVNGRAYAVGSIGGSTSM